jgi:hypothetical protein
MGVSTEDDRVCRLRRKGAPFGLVVSKLRRPSVRRGTVRRSVLIERLARGDPRPIVPVVAPAGYGKTTLPSDAGLSVILGCGGVPIREVPDGG